MMNYGLRKNVNSKVVILRKIRNEIKESPAILFQSLQRLYDIHFYVIRQGM